MDWHALILLPLGTALTLAAAGHALLHKSDPHSAWGWIAVCWLLPFGGPLLYFLFGINRINTHARKRGFPGAGPATAKPDSGADARHQREASALAIPHGLNELARTADALTRRPLLAGNHITALHNGEQAYPRMLAAIDAAQHSIAFVTYIFETNRSGQQFAEALARAQARGVELRCLIDGIGELHNWPHAGRMLRRRGVPFKRFNPPRLLPPSVHINLRNHRKLLICDGRIAYTGGMNIGDTYLGNDIHNSRRATDMHFELRGPVIGQLARAFADDWRYASGQEWAPPAPPPPVATDGAACRVITDGPNEDLGNLTMVLMAALSCAHHRIQIMSPYFLPPREMIVELQGAARRGVDVSVILPALSDGKIVHWATRNLLGQLLQHGVKIYYQPPPFCHTKLFLIDNHYAQIGSANMDTRSLRLNFELAVEVYDSAFAHQLSQHFESIRAGARQVTSEEIGQRRLLPRIRDALCWLFSPYL
ncbi:MAG TPA: phospholipase D-like domain-containing protein [Stenotrophobium sp.]|jgi:cardiolipin synthase|nr:phospholipase D-like domain-containing protein [Stenotrophobium sp.]